MFPPLGFLCSAEERLKDLFLRREHGTGRIARTPIWLVVAIAPHDIS